MVSAAWLPFLVTTVDKRHISMQRVIEALIIASVSAGAAAFMTVRQMEVKMEHIHQSISRMEHSINGAIVTIERRREILESQLDVIKGDINRLKVDMASRK